MKNKVKLCFLSNIKKHWHNFTKKMHLLFSIITSSEIRLLPSSLAYYLILSFFPLIALLGYISSLFNISVSSVMDYFNSYTVELSGFLNSIINVKGVGFNSIFYVLLALMLSANGAYSIIVASNELYHVKKSNLKTILFRRVKAFILIIILLNIFIFTVIVLGFGNTIFNWLINYTTLDEAINKIFPIFLLFKWPVAFLAIFISIKLIYVIAPDIKIVSSSVSKGAIFTTIGWIIITFLYSYYVNNIANYNLFYGNLSSIIVLFIWTYIISYILVIGIAINTNNYHLEEQQKEV